MPQELNIDIVDDIVHVQVSGAFSLSNAKLFFQEVLHHALEAKLGKILVDTRGITSGISALARYEFGDHMSEIGPSGIKIAFVGSVEGVWPDRFLENVAQNRGLNVKVTTDIEEAHSWLNE